MASPLAVADAAKALQHGAVIAYPTEAVWGLGCDPFDHEAVKRLLAIKQRPVEKGLILVAANLAQLQPCLAELNVDQQQQITAESDRPTTWLVPCNHQKVPDWISGGHELLAIRICKHPVVRRLCELADMPLVSTSANPQGRPPARSRTQVRDYFGDTIETCEGEIGDADQPSMIKNLLTGQLIRE